MSTPNPTLRHAMRAALLATSLLAATPALAQLTTSTIRGVVSSGTTAAPGATVTAVNVETNATTRTVAGPTGSYVLTGLSPGTYDIKFSAAGGVTSSQRVTVEVGQTASLDADTSAAVATAPPPGERGAIVVVGRRLVETRTSEIGTNVSQDQIQNLPQNNRNFINFAGLAPGIRVNQRSSVRPSPVAASARTRTAKAPEDHRSTCLSTASA